MKKILLILMMLGVTSYAATPIKDLVLQSNANGSSNVFTNIFLNVKSGNTNGIAPIKFNAGMLLSTPQAGALEFDGTNFYATISGVQQSLTLGGGPGPTGTLTNISTSSPLTGGPITLNGTIGFDGTQAFNLPGATNLTAPNLSGLVPITSLATGSGDTTKFLRYDQTWAVPAGGGGGSASKNYLLNSDFPFFQRFTNVLGTNSITDASYGPDRWKLINSAGGAGANCTRIANPYDGAVYAGRFSSTNASAQIGIVQYLEGADCQDLRGQAVTFSGNVRINGIATNVVRTAIIQWGSTVDTITSDPILSWAAVPNFVANMTTAATPGSTTCVASGTWYSFTHTATLNNTFNNLGVIIYSNDALATNITFDVTNLKFEKGSSATTYARQQPNLPSELLSCQRYFETIAFDFNVMLTSMQAVNSYIGVGPVNFRATKRIVSTVTAANQTQFYMTSATAANLYCTNLVFNGTVDLLKVTAYTTNGLTAGNCTVLQSQLPSNTITLDSEL